jgi:hypothetical protein
VRKLSRSTTSCSHGAWGVLSKLKTNLVVGIKQTLQYQQPPWSRPISIVRVHPDEAATGPGLVEAAPGAASEPGLVKAGSKPGLIGTVTGPGLVEPASGAASNPGLVTLPAWEPDMEGPASICSHGSHVTGAC